VLVCVVIVVVIIMAVVVVERVESEQVVSTARKNKDIAVNTSDTTYHHTVHSPP
jgi:hypothetical protein